MPKLTINQTTYLYAVHASMAILLVGIKHSFMYILLILSISIFVPITTRWAKVVGMINLGKFSSLSYVYGSLSLGVGLPLLSSVQKNLIMKIWMFSGVLSMGICLFTIMILFDGKWYVQK